jgi:P-type E1-E2 ATPase
VRGPVLEIARALGISAADAEFESTPVQKAALIEMRRTGHKVAFVGDGLNDAVALCAADLAVAATGATDLAMQVAHVALREGGIARLPEALALAQKTRRVMRQNIAWAIGYNLVALPVAVAGLAPPIAAALAMALSSVTVIGNSLRLRSRHGPP